MLVDESEREHFDYPDDPDSDESDWSNSESDDSDSGSEAADERAERRAENAFMRRAERVEAIELAASIERSWRIARFREGRPAVGVEPEVETEIEFVLDNLIREGVKFLQDFALLYELQPKVVFCWRALFCRNRIYRDLVHSTSCLPG